MHAPLNPVFNLEVKYSSNRYQIMWKKKLLDFSHSLKMGRHNLFNICVIM